MIQPGSSSPFAAPSAYINLNGMMIQFAPAGPDEKTKTVARTKSRARTGHFQRALTQRDRVRDIKVRIRPPGGLPSNLQGDG